MITTSDQIAAGELTDAQVFATIYAEAGKEKFDAEDIASRAFHKQVNAMSRGKAAARSRAARKLDNALASLSTLSPTERLGFLVLVRAEIASSVRPPETVDSDDLLS